MLSLLGSTLQHSNLTQQDILNKNSSRALAIEERRKRLEEAKQQNSIGKSMDNIKKDDIGFVGKILSMTTGNLLFISSINAIVEGLEKAGVSSTEDAFASIKKADSKASNEDIENLLEILSEKSDKFNELMKKDLETYELLNNVEYREKLQEQVQEQNRKNLEEKNKSLLDEITSIEF